MSITDLDRRSFLKMLGGGIVVFVSFGPKVLLGQGRRPSYPSDFNAYLRVDEDGHVTVFSGKIEMGQGVMTSQAQMVAEELGVALDAIEMCLGDTERCPWDMGTFGSLTTRMFGPVLRTAAAEARAVLMALAAERLGVASEGLVVADGVVSARANSDKTVSYGELAKGKAIARTVDGEAVLRAVSEMAVMGSSPTRLDAHAKVTGAAKYAGDMALPGMLHARILRPPAHGAELLQVDTKAAQQVAGVTVVNQDGIVAVLHADRGVAGDARDRIVAKWNDAEPGADHDGIFDELLAKAPALEVAAASGDIAAARSTAAKSFERSYRKGYVAHAPLEPHTAVAKMVEGKLTVWASTQTPFPTRDALAQTLGIDPKNVRVITPYVGGGFGGKSTGQQAVEAARLAVITGKPVQVAWSREEEFFFDTFDPAAIVNITSAVDDEAKITLWDYDVYFAGDRGAELYYDVPNVRMRVAGGWRGPGAERHRFAVGPWRAPGANMNVWARESQIDTMAAAVGIDPLEFRLRNTSDERMRRVLRAAAKQFGWKPAAGPSGRGHGVACGIDAGTYAALMAEVEVEAASGAVTVVRVVAAQDMGLVVNPEGAKMQMEGCITMGLGYVFTEELRFQGGQMLDQNFDTYEIPRFSWVPKIETVLVKNDALAPQGGGEPAIVPMGGVIANAVFDATGARVDRLPMTPARVLEALEKKEKRAG